MHLSNGVIIITIIIPLFITFGGKNYGNITIKIQNYVHIKLGINDCLCLTVHDTGILRCAGLVLQAMIHWLV